MRTGGKGKGRIREEERTTYTERVGAEPAERGRGRDEGGGGMREGEG